ncbi:MAG: TonB-dependent receptor [Woeseiaceae bacterium]|nr:TonB-dependent receptor [Woeseiaceae bacterium]
MTLKQLLHLSGFLALAAQAQDAPAGIEEIVVTAQKRAQSLGDVGIAVTAFTRDDVQELRLTQPIDVAAHTPNLDIKNVLGSTHPVITIRGVGLNDFIANNSQSTGVYVDEVFLTSPAMMSFQLYDLDRIEVLKGPQGTLYGRNTTAGAINFISRRPTRQPGAYLNLSYGRFEQIEAEGAVGGGVSDTLAGRLSFKVVSRGEGQISNLAAGNDDHGEIDRYAGRTQLLWTPTDAVTALFNVHGGREDSDSGALWKSFGILDFANGSLDPSLGLPVCAAFATAGRSDPSTGCHDLAIYADSNFGDPYRGEWDQEARLDSDSWGATAAVTWDVAELTLTSISGFEDFDRELSEDVDGPNNGLNIVFVNTVRQFSQELRLASEGNGRLRWVTGLFYSNDEVLGTPSQRIVATDWLSTTVRVAWEQDTDVVAAFGQTEYQITDQVRIKIGGRFTKETRHYVGGSTDLNPLGASCLLDANCSPGFTGPVVLSNADTRIDESDFSGNIGLDWTATDNSLVYVSFSNGFKSGGVPGGFTLSNVELSSYGPEDINAFEIGVKARLAGDRLQINAAAFFYDYEGLQLFRIPPNEITTRLTNSEKARISGLDADLWWRPLPGLDFKLGLGLLNTENKDSDFAGFELPNAPELTVNGSIRYEAPLGSRHRLFAMSSFNYSDERFTCVEQLELCRARDYTLVNARAGIASADRRWELAFWSQNLTNEIYEVEIFQLLSLGAYAASYNMPRTSGISFAYHWN